MGQLRPVLSPMELLLSGSALAKVREDRGIHMWSLTKHITNHSRVIANIIKRLSNWFSLSLLEYETEYIARYLQKANF